MVLFLNYVPFFIFALTLFVLFKQFQKHKTKDKLWLALRLFNVALLGIALWIAVGVIQTSYMPKNVPDRLPTPEFAEPEEKSNEIRDIQRKPPMNAEQSKAHFDEMVDWRKHKAEREAAKTEESK